MNIGKPSDKIEESRSQNRINLLIGCRTTYKNVDKLRRGVATSGTVTVEEGDVRVLGKIGRNSAASWCTVMDRCVLSKRADADEDEDDDIDGGTGRFETLNCEKWGSFRMGRTSFVFVIIHRAFSNRQSHRVFT
jgi:hypothetical protein